MAEPIFPEVLDEALAAVITVKQAATILASNSISADRAQVFLSAKDLEARVAEVGSYLDSLRSVVRNARHHTIESAYREIVGQPGREEEADKLRRIMNEIKEIQRAINTANQNISNFLKILNNSAKIIGAYTGDMPDEHNLLDKA